MTASISRASFNEALKTIQRIRTKYTPEEGQDYYNNPDAALDLNKRKYFLAPLIYWCRDEQTLIDDQALRNAIQIVTRHFRDHYHNQGKLEAFEKTPKMGFFQRFLRYSDCVIAGQQLIRGTTRGICRRAAWRFRLQFRQFRQNQVLQRLSL